MASPHPEPNPDPDQDQQPAGQPGEIPAPAQAFAALTARVEALERELAWLRGARIAAPPGWEPTVAAPPIPPVSTPAPPPAPAFAAAPPTCESLEDRLGAQIFSRVGIIALLAGATWFLKWAVDNRWIGPLGRIVIGLIAGASLILWSERFRRKGFAAFSYTLKAVGSGVLYLSLWAAFHLYHLLPAPVALAAMILVTAWNAWMAWAQDAELLAVYALAGAFVTPVLLSAGGNHEIFLFTYVAATDLGAVLLVRLKPWPRLLIPALAATVLYFIGWYVSFFSPSVAVAQAQLPATLFFLAVFFSLFAAVSLKPHTEAVDLRYGPILLDIAVPLANAAFFSLALYSALEDSGHHALLPWAAILLAALYLGLTRLQRNPAAAAVHLSLAVVFLTIAIPLKATGRWITVGWLAEGTALLWASSRVASGNAPESDQAGRLAEPMRALRLLAAAALSLGFCGLVSLPFWLFGDIPTAFFNSRFATSLTGIAAFALSILLARRAANATADQFWTTTTVACTLALSLIAIQAGVTEIVTFWHNSSGPDKVLASNLSLSGFLGLYGASLLAVGFWRRSAFLRWQALILLLFTIAKVFLYDISGLSEGYRVASFLGLGAILLAVSFVYQKNLLGLRAELDSPSQREEDTARP
jgi:uncharacterized membrane protein